jgi:hypothetical protein
VTSNQILFGVADAVWTGAFATVLAAFIAWLKYDTDRKTRKDARETRAEAARASEAATEAASRVEEVKTTLQTNTTATDVKLQSIAATGEKTHTLVNSNMGVQLKLNAVLSRRLADMTKAPLDISVADQAERLLREHEGKQASVDAQQDTKK